jgi:histidinol-phosphate/aromatic aminotransferase/cobyric acid decarboxylase-like protein
LPSACDDSDFVVVTNPNNPTGRLERAESVEQLAGRERLLVVDESFMDFACDRETFAHRQLPGVIVLRSCTKLLSLAGVRAGYLITETSLVRRLEEQRQPWSVNGLACAALSYFAAAREVVAERIDEARRDRQDLVKQLTNVAGAHVYPSVTNFVLVRLPRDDVPERLRQVGVAVRPATGFGGLSCAHIRVAARSAADNAILAQQLAEANGDD